MSDMTSPTSQVAALISRGKEQGYLTYAEVNDHLPDSITESEQIEDIIQMLQDVGIPVHERAPESDDAMFEDTTEAADEVAEEEAAAVLASVENEPGRTTDPVRMYMREMGTVELLTREGEISIAKRIRRRDSRCSCTQLLTGQMRLKWYYKNTKIMKMVNAAWPTFFQVI